MDKFTEKLVNYMSAGFPILYIHTYEEGKALAAVRNAARERDAEGEVSEWDGTSANGIGKDLETFLELIISKKKHQTIILKNSAPLAENESSDAIARLKVIASNIACRTCNASIVIISPVLRFPQELERFITILGIDYLSDNEIESRIHKFVTDNRLKVSNSFTQTFANALKGLSEYEISSILRLALAVDGELTNDHLQLIFEQKQQMIKKTGLLEMVPLKESMEDIGGLESLKIWLKRKARVFNDISAAEQFGVDIPKGALIAGIPGCGKSLSAKAVAQLFGVPLLRLDMGRLLGKYVGESEANMRRGIELAEAISPCILWVDEMEKAFAGISGNGGGNDVTMRLLGHFLTWLQEKNTPVFVLATANDITKLPPELLRKGRFDDIFYVGLPKVEERRRIFDIHIKKRRPCDLANIDLKKLAYEAEGYSGADIEGMVREAVEKVYAEDRKALETKDLMSILQNTQSLSKLMGDSLEKMEAEYKRRCFKNASTQEG